MSTATSAEVGPRIMPHHIFTPSIWIPVQRTVDPAVKVFIEHLLKRDLEVEMRRGHIPQGLAVGTHRQEQGALVEIV